jgi:hypothetical protein
MLLEVGKSIVYVIERDISQILSVDEDEGYRSELSCR